MSLIKTIREICNPFYSIIMGFPLYSLLIFLSINIASAQTTIEPTSITLGIDQINMVNGDTILHWGKTRSAFRGGFFQSTDITNSNAGTNSFAYGRENQAGGDASFALGNFNKANKGASFALGARNNVDATAGFAFGLDNEVNGAQSYAIGEQLITNSIFAIALGRYNVDYADPADDDDRPLFVLGNGDRGDNRGRSNAITVLNDGRMSLRTTTPESDLHLVHQNFSANSGFRIENEAGTGSGKYWRFYVRSMNDELALYNHTSSSAVGEFNGAGVYSNLSDRRHKKNIIELPYGLKEVLQLSPKKYQFKHINATEDIGLIAQDVLKLIPELVSYNIEDDTYKMNYNGFGVLSIKAIQQLHAIVEKQSITITHQQALIADLIKRFEQLEESK